jgi:hypothetical protein
MSDKAVSTHELNLPWQDCETAAGRGKVVDKSGFSVCNTSGGSYAGQREKAKFIRIAANNHYKLVEALEYVLKHGLLKGGDKARQILAEVKL